MCRLAFLPNECELSQREIKGLFSFLETQCGGDGNGIACMSPDGKITEYRKGIRLSTKRCSTIARKHLDNGDNVLFHTRLVSRGSKSNRQCHPFLCKGSEFFGAVAHNGTWAGIDSLLSYAQLSGRGEYSDSQMFSVLLAEYGETAMVKAGLWPTSGVWMILDSAHAVCYVEKLSGELCYEPVSGIYASDFPAVTYPNHYPIKDGIFDMLSDKAPEEDTQIYSGMQGHYYVPSKYRIAHSNRTTN